MHTVGADHDITRLLQRAGGGDQDARSELYRILYGELEALARKVLGHRASAHTLDPSALVSEAYFRLVKRDERGVGFRSRGHFCASAVIAMRCVLVDYARGKHRIKRQPTGPLLPLSIVSLGVEDQFVEALDLEQALSWLAERDVQAARVAEMRVFCGLSIEEIATHLALSVRTAEREWQHARARLRARLQESAP